MVENIKQWRGKFLLVCLISSLLLLGWFEVFLGAAVIPATVTGPQLSSADINRALEQTHLIYHTLPLIRKMN